jgi:hypothetical protein
MYDIYVLAQKVSYSKHFLHLQPYSIIAAINLHYFCEKTYIQDWVQFTYIWKIETIKNSTMTTWISIAFTIWIQVQISNCI